MPLVWDQPRHFRRFFRYFRLYVRVGVGAGRSLLSARSRDSSVTFVSGVLFFFEQAQKSSKLFPTCLLAEFGEVCVANPSFFFVLY